MLRFENLLTFALEISDGEKLGKNEDANDDLLEANQVRTRLDDLRKRGVSVNCARRREEEEK